MHTQPHITVKVLLLVILLSKHNVNLIDPKQCLHKYDFIANFNYSCDCFFIISTLHLVLELNPGHESTGLVNKALLVGLEVCSKRLLVPGRIRDEGHECVGAVDVAPLDIANAVKLNLFLGYVLGYSRVQTNHTNTNLHLRKVLRRNLAEDPCTKRVTRRIKQGMLNPDPVVIVQFLTGLLINVNPNNVFVETE